MPSSLQRVGSLGGKLAFASNVITAPATNAFTDSGAIMLEAKAFTQWLFQPVGSFGAGTDQIVMYVLGTCDPTTTGYQGPLTPDNPDGWVAATTNNWFPIVAQSSEGTDNEDSDDVFTWNNPLYGNNASGLSTLATLLGSATYLSDSLNAKVHGLIAVRVIVANAGASGASEVRL